MLPVKIDLNSLPQTRDDLIHTVASGNSAVAWMGENTDYVAAAGDDACVTLWLTSETGTQPKAILKEHDDIVSSLATNPQKPDLIASGSWDAKIKLWNLGREESVDTFEGSEVCKNDATHGRSPQVILLQSLA